DDRAEDQLPRDRARGRALLQGGDGARRRADAGLGRDRQPGGRRARHRALPLHAVPPSARRSPDRASARTERTPRRVKKGATGMTVVTTSLREKREQLVRDHMETENRHEFDATLETFKHPRYEL